MRNLKRRSIAWAGEVEPIVSSLLTSFSLVLPPPGLDQANKQKLVAQNTDLARSIQKLKNADERQVFLFYVLIMTCVLLNTHLNPSRMARELQDHGYIFSVSERPPTPTLDQLTQYLQVCTSRCAPQLMLDS